MPDSSDALVELLVHELRGPLTVISGYAEILRRPTSADEQRRGIEAIERAVARADAILEDFAAGRLGQSRVEMTDRISLTVLVEHAAEEERASTGREVLVETHGEAAVLGDVTQLERLLANLLTNADKYSPTSEPIALRMERREDRALIEVVDRGPGIPVEDRERLFEGFERLDRDADTPGMGLGLSVVRTIALGHGGSTWIETGDDGVGTKVVVELPLAL